MFPQGHARCESERFEELLVLKHRMLLDRAGANAEDALDKWTGLLNMTPRDIAQIYDVVIGDAS